PPIHQLGAAAQHQQADDGQQHGDAGGEGGGPHVRRLPLSRWRKRGLGRGAFLAALSQDSKRFRPPAGGRATSLLLVHACAGAHANSEAGPQGRRAGCPESRRSSQEKTTPRGGAFHPSMGGKSVSRGRAFRAGSCPREKASPSMASPAARPCRPRLTAAEGPHKSRCASCAPEATARAKAG